MKLINVKRTSKRTQLLHPFFVFFKAQLSAFVGGMVDYAVMVFLTEVFGLHYTLSIVIGGIIGSFVNFGINKQWTFFSRDVKYSSKMKWQVVKFAIMVVDSFTLKALGTYLFSETLKIDYKIVRLGVDLFVSLAVNYSLQKYWVFKKAKTF